LLLREKPDKPQRSSLEKIAYASKNKRIYRALDFAFNRAADSLHKNLHGIVTNCAPSALCG